VIQRPIFKQNIQQVGALFWSHVETTWHPVLDISTWQPDQTKSTSAELRPYQRSKKGLFLKDDFNRKHTTRMLYLG